MSPLRPNGIAKVLGAILIEKSCRNKIIYLILNVDGSNLELVDNIDEFGVCTDDQISNEILTTINTFLKSKESRPEGVVLNSVYSHTYRIYKKGLKNSPDIH
jgi:hypothetical protein